MKIENVKDSNKAESSQVSEMAAMFVARIHSGDLSAKDERELLEWLDAKPEHQEEFDTMLAIHDGAGELANDPELRAMMNNDRAINGASNTSRKPWAWGVAASFLLAISVLVLFRPFGQDDPAPQILSYSTEIGEQRIETLPDGSLLELNTDTQIKAVFSTSARQLILDSGEAYFTVAKNPDAPFSVTSANYAITATGTQFNVQAVDDNLTVAVTEGAVLIHPANMTGEEVFNLIKEGNWGTSKIEGLFRVEAGSIATINALSVKAIRVDNIEHYDSWRSGYLKFENRSVASLIKELSRYTSDEIEVQGASISEKNINGLVNLRDVDSLWLGLAATSNIEVTRLPGRIILTEKQPASER